jgi:EF-P beta-lysylation protein EpmB
VHCRYCFRRNFPYAEHQTSRADILRIQNELAGDPQLSEIILSGGDPLSLGDNRLAEMLAVFDALPGLRRIRLHTRMPVVLPERVDDGLLQILRSVRKPLVIVLHFNHGNEIDASVAIPIKALRKLGVTLLNQSVLLAGVNDSIEALEDLSSGLFDIGVLPYYLHQLDPVAGAAHFQVEDARAIGLLRGLRHRLPGYLVPQLVREIPGEAAKQPLPW